MASRIAISLKSRGVGPGDKVLMWLDTTGLLACVDWAIQLIGATTVGLIPSFSGVQVKRAMVMTKAKAIFSEPERLAVFNAPLTADEAGRAAAEVAAGSPNGDPVFDVRTFSPPAIQVVVQGQGAVVAPWEPLESFMSPAGSEASFAATPVTPHTDSSVFFSSGTTGNPKGVVHTHGSLVACCNGILPAVLADEMRATGNVVANEVILLLHFPASQLHHSVMLPMISVGAEIVFVEEDYARQSFLDVRPTLFFTAPIGLQTMMKGIKANIRKLGFIKRFVVNRHMKRGAAGRIDLAIRGGGDDGARAKGAVKKFLKAQSPEDAGKLDPEAWHRANRDLKTLGKIRANFGGRLRMLLVSMAKSDIESVRFFWALGIPVMEVYGSTECNLITANRHGAVKLDSSGKPLPNSIVKISAEGEVLVGGGVRFDRYFEAPAVTASAIDSEGFYHTGDIGVIDQDGFLRITDRMAHRIKKTDGALLSPQTIESAIADHQDIRMLAVVGNERPFLIALVVPADPQAAKKDIFAAVQAEHKAKGLQGYERIHNIVIVKEPFTPENGCLTETKKLRRREIEAMYKKEIDAVYAQGSLLDK